MKKRTLSAFLALVMLFSLVSTAFAKEIAPTVDKNELHKGDEVNVTLSVDEAITAMQGMTVDVTYDNNLFTYKVDELTNDALYETEYETVAATVKDSANKLAIMENKVRVNVITTSAKGMTLRAGAFVTLTFVAKADVTEAQTGEFISDVTYLEMAGTDRTDYSSEYPDSKISVTVTPASAEPDGYAVDASAVAESVTVNEDAQVALKINNKDADNYNAYYMEVSYDSSILTYTGNDAGATVTDDGSGNLKIAGYGDNRACGDAGKIVLTFTGKAVGEAKVTVNSAKVDAKANAAEKDAPEATITTKEATITVGGYQVILPDDFTGKGTANPGEDYTFTAKDTSKKYDFTGSTMGGETVEIIDNGDGTYTVKNVTGPLTIAATAQASKVAINLSGDAVDTITQKSWGDATEVDEGTALWFMAAPNGKELVVTVNGEEITGINMQSFMRYTIDAAKVTGDTLNIAVNYKAADDQATIIESGTAWGNVSNLSRSGWTASGDKVDAGATLFFFFKPETGKTIDDYVIQANGVDCTYSKVAGRYKVTIPAEVITAGATVDIYFDYVTVPEPTITVNATEYVKLDGQSIFLITAACDELAEGKVLAYGENQMYWSAKYNEGNGAYAWLVISDKGLDEVKTEAAAQVKAVDGTKVEIAYNGDVNLTESVDINDAQLVWNMYSAEYSSFETVNVRKFLEADMTADGVLNTADSVAIITLITK